MSLKLQGIIEIVIEVNYFKESIDIILDIIPRGNAVTIPLKCLWVFFNYPLKEGFIFQDAMLVVRKSESTFFGTVIAVIIIYSIT